MSSDGIKNLNPSYLRMLAPRYLEAFFWECLAAEPPAPNLWQERFADVSQFSPAVSSMLAELAWCWSIVSGRADPAALPKWLLDSKPLAVCELSLRSLLEHAEHSAMAVIPLAGQNGQPPCLARLYGLKSREASLTKHCDLVDEKRFTEEHSWLLLLPSVESLSIDGQSWQLAAALIKLALDPLLKDMRKTLATAWVISGKCDSKDKVTKITLGNKPALARQQAGRSRQWLLPESNAEELKCSLAATEVDVFGVSHLADAVSYILGQGVQELPRMPFPSSVYTLHQLVGGSISPQLSVPLLLNPKKLLLWHSEETQALAELVKCFFERRKSLAISVELRLIPSNRLSLCELRLRQGFTANPAETSLVNITGGNRLMGQAALLAAKFHRMRVVYRDVDAVPDELDVIDFVSHPIDLIQNGKIQGNLCPEPSAFDWEALFQRSSWRELPEITEIEEKFLRDTTTGG
jgi:hypothetical protein